MDDWAKTAEKELRYRIAEFYVALEQAAESSGQISLVLGSYKKHFGIDEETAIELCKMARKGNNDERRDY